MARVVQRSSPPYLTILFVFLFFIATALAGWFYSEWRDAETGIASLSDSIRSLATKRELNSETMVTLKARASGESRTVFDQYGQDVDQLIEAIVGSAAAADMDPAGALDRAKQLNAATGLADLATRLRTEVKDGAQRETDLQTLLDQTAARVAKAMRDAGDTQRTLSEQLGRNREDLAALQATFDTLSTSFQSNVAEANTDWENRVKALQADLAKTNAEIIRLTVANGDLAEELRILKGPKPGTGTGAKPDIQADGEILEVLNMGDHTVVYINIGREDRVRTGLTFTIYSKRTGVSADARDKGSIVVKSVSAGTAECRVLRAETGDPVVVGDLISNLAFSSMGRPVFVVQGRFDLDGDGEADAQGNATVKAMIERFGGNVAEQITVDTDYVVMGMEPRRMAPPDTDAPATDVALFEQNEQMIQQYREMVNRGIALNKPILNTNQLLSYIGFAPEVLDP